MAGVALQKSTFYSILKDRPAWCGSLSELLSYLDYGRPSVILHREDNREQAMNRVVYQSIDASLIGDR